MQLKPLKRAKGEHKTTLSNGISLRNIFQNRKDVFKGLTKFETISKYTGEDIKDVLKWNEKDVKRKWKEIFYVKKYLRKKGIISIISKEMPVGFTLTDREFGKRQLQKVQSIYFSCSTDEDVSIYRARLDKIAKGCIKAVAETENIVAELEKQKEILNEAIAI